MAGPRSHILVIVLLLACELPAWGQAATASPEAQVVPPAQVDQELVLIKDHLLNNKDAATRISAATVLLFKEDPAARKLVLEILMRGENPTARTAICNALERARRDPKPLKDKEDFLQPLLGILGTEADPSVARSAAEATLMFSYDQVQGGLEKIAGDVQMPAAVRDNVIYALQLHPDRRAVLKLISLLGDSDREVARAAGVALTFLGISLPEDEEGRRRGISEIEQLTPEAYLRKRLVRSETDIRTLKAGMQMWQDYYLSSLSDWYGSLADETAKIAFLTERLKAQEPEIKLWALDRIEQLKKGTSKPKLSEDFEKTLLGLVSSKNRQVRLRTARVMALMWELNAAQRLLGQLQVEDDGDVRHELFVALGGACYYASLDTSPFKIPDEVRKETLEWAVRFLNEQRAERVRSGADVIRKLLTQNGLKAEEVNKYLASLGQRYQQVASETDRAVRSDLLGAMAGLCAQRSACRLQAARLYSPLFEQGLTDSAEAVRQAAIDGLVNIDSVAALKRLRKGLVDDPSASVRAKVINLAGESGVAEDLDWLSKKLGVPSDGEAAWQASLKVFRRCAMDVLATWSAAFTAPPLQEKLSVDQRIAYFMLVEQRAQTESRPDVLAEARRRLAQLYATSGNFKQADDYLKLIEETAEDPKEKERILSDRLGVCLRWPNLDMVGEIVDTYLSVGDLTDDSAIARSIDGYLKEPPSGADPNALIERLSRIKVKDPDARPGWRGLVQRWGKPVARARKGGETEGVNN
ncbi:MAG: HEAT repeat domain-containing protein [Sedimentisphaerales bacterium]|nr:HEAT repeat domain-containing protein [Sedimentisphaerales bacterium]